MNIIMILRNYFIYSKSTIENTQWLKCISMLFFIFEKILISFIQLANKVYIFTNWIKHAIKQLTRNKTIAKIFNVIPCLIKKPLQKRLIIKTFNYTVFNY